MTDADYALQWFQENVMALKNPKALSCTWTQEGQVLLLVSEEDDLFNWLTIMWTSWLDGTGYQQQTRHVKRVRV